MIIRGTSTPALRTLSSVSLAVFSMLGQNGSIDGGGAGAAGQTVQLGNFAGSGSLQPHLLGNVADTVLVLHIINTVDLAGDDDLCALAGQLLNGGLDRCVGQGIIDKIAVMQMDGAPGAEVNVLQIRLRLGDPAAGAFAADADDTDLCNVALDQGRSSPAWWSGRQR